jgi:hypothetical protein
MTRTHLIGLLLGTEDDWPTAFEQYLGRLAPRIELDGETHEVATERVTIEPFDLRQPCRYDLVVDRLTHWYNTSREWIKKAVIMDGLYVFNNPWAIQSMGPVALAPAFLDRRSAHRVSSEIQITGGHRPARATDR